MPIRIIPIVSQLCSRHTSHDSDVAVGRGKNIPIRIIVSAFVNHTIPALFFGVFYPTLNRKVVCCKNRICSNISVIVNAVKL